MTKEVNHDERMDKEDPNLKVEIATMKQNGGIMIIDKGALASGQPTLATQDISQKDPEYIEYCKSFNLNKPGDSYFKVYRLKDNNWVLESEGKNDR